MQVKSIVECSNGSILQYFLPSLSYHLSLRSLFCLFLSGFTVDAFKIVYTPVYIGVAIVTQLNMKIEQIHEKSTILGA